MIIACSDHPFFPQTKFSMPRLTCRGNFLQSFLMKTKIKSVCYYLKIKITGQTKHTQLCSIACFTPTNSFKQMKENMNFSWTTIFTTTLFFWQVCVCSAQGDTPWTPFFFSFFFFFNWLSCHFSFSLCFDAYYSLVLIGWNLNLVLLFFSRRETYPIKIKTAGCFKLNPCVCTRLVVACTCIMCSLSEASTLQHMEQNFVLSSSHLLQYDPLALLGHNLKQWKA